MVKKKLGDLTLNEIAKICKIGREKYFGCKGCSLEKDYRCMATFDLPEYTDKEFEEEFPKILDQEIEVENEKENW